MKAGHETAVVAAVLADYRTAPIPEPLRATLAFLEKLTLDPASVSAEDLAPARAAGVTDDAIEEAIRVCFLFSAMDRLADALDFTLPTPRSLRMAARILLGPGYGAASIPG